MFTLAARLVGLRRYFPSNIALAWLATRAGLKWGMPAMLLVPAYGALGYWLHAQATVGGPGWLSLLALICAISAIKFAVNGPISLLRLAAARAREARLRRQLARQDAELIDA